MDKLKILDQIKITLFVLLIVLIIAEIILAIVSRNIDAHKDKDTEQIETMQTEIEDLRNKLEELQTTSKEEAAEVTGPKDYSNIGTDIDLKECPLCHSTNVVLLAHSKEFYIRCEDCWLFTRDWDSKDDLISYWNGR